jgi:hypothetical protein
LQFSRLQHTRISGWLTRVDSVLIPLLLQLQISQGDAGDILEIGVYKGKLVPIYASNMIGSETLVLCDLFDTMQSSHENQLEISYSYETTRVAEITELLLKYPEISVTIFAGNSLHLAPRLAEWKFRFIHVDGSHLYEIVKRDIVLALKYLDAKSGILVIDDYRSIHAPGVTRAVWELLGEDDVRVIIRSPAKIYLVKKTSTLSIQSLREYISLSNSNISMIERDDIDGLIATDNRDNLYKGSLGERIVSRVLNSLRIRKRNDTCPKNVRVIYL